MNFLECLSQIGVGNLGTKSMLNVVVIKQNPAIESVFNTLVREFKEAFVTLLSEHTFDEYSTEVGNGKGLTIRVVDVTDVIDDEFFYPDEEEEEVVDESKLDNFNGLLTKLAQTDVYFVRVKDNQIIYTL